MSLCKLLTVKRKCEKSQCNYTLRENTLYLIVSVKNPYELESSKKELDQRSSKGKLMCNVYGKVVLQASSLRRHVSIHTRESNSTSATHVGMCSPSITS